jgi:ubiquitin-conjugating enzyme E2 J2
MVEKHAIARLNRELALLERSDCKQFMARPSEGDTLCWHYVIYNLPKDSPYYGGQYHGKFVFPREYPLKPPSIYMITPSGRFEVSTRLCLSMSDFHPETWNPSWRIETILLGLVSFMLDESDPATAGGIRSTRAHRHDEARISFFRNSRNKDMRLLFPELLEFSSYFPGIGYLRNEHPNGVQSLADLHVSPATIDSIQTVTDLDSVLRTAGFAVTTHPSVEYKQKEALNRLVPWLAVCALVCVWWVQGR